ncbi:lysophosphatidic acid receptor 6-like [Lampetra fluviatilis]
MQANASGVPGNVTEGCACDYRGLKRTLFVSTYSAVFIVGLALNGVALWGFFQLQSRNLGTVIFMMNLAFTDMFLVFTLPFKIYYYHRGTWPFTEVFCRICTAAFYVNLYGGAFFMAFISIDRFLAIVHPISSRSARRPRYAKFASFAVWVFTVGASSSLLVRPLTDSEEPKCFESFSKRSWDSFLLWVIVAAGTICFTCLAVILCCSCAVLAELHRPRTMRNDASDKHRIMAMIVVNVSLFVFCFVPFHAVLPLYRAMRLGHVPSCSAECAIRVADIVSHCLVSTNCCFDPVMYYFTAKTFRETLSKHKISLSRSSSHRQASILLSSVDNPSSG